MIVIIKEMPQIDYFAGFWERGESLEEKEEKLRVRKAIMS